LSRVRARTQLDDILAPACDEVRGVRRSRADRRSPATRFIVEPSTALRHRALPADDGLVTALARPLPLTDLRRIAARAPRRCLALLVASAACALLGTATAQAVVVEGVAGHKFGVAPHLTNLETGTYDPFTALEYGGGPVVPTNATYAIYWDPAKLRPGDPGRPGKYHGDWQELINGFLQGVGAESNALANVFALTPQYTEAGGAQPQYNSTFRGGNVDVNSYPSDGCTDPDQALNKNFACLTDQQLREELRSFIATNGLEAGMGTIFYIFTPPGVTVCTDAGTEAGHCSDSSNEDPWGTPSVGEEVSYSRSFCSYHSDTATLSSKTLLYAVIPWTAGTLGSNLEPAGRSGSDCQDGTEITEEPNQGLAPDGYYDHGLPDVLINQIAAQTMATTTNPLFDGWDAPLSKNEVSDQCRNWFEGPPIVQGSNSPDVHTGAGTYSNQLINGRNYYLNTEFNQAALYYDYPGLTCELHVNLVPAFTAPNPVNAGDVVGFDGNESDVTLEQSADATPSSQPLYRATFSWDFGDGTSVSGPGYSAASPSDPLYASVYHSYTYGGTYAAILTVKDVGGHTASVRRTITVVGPPPPAEGGSGASGATTQTSAAVSGSTSGGGAGTTAGGAGATHPSPVATQAVVSHSLSTVLKKGLVVRYSVSEQVAGRFEVLLASSIARKLGLHGARATGLANGTPPQTVIAKAILVTTKGGRNTYTIKFSKTTAARLRRLRKVTLMLRLAVHNASSPTVTTVLSTVNLSH
jgi:hypothetical protein